jgi:hypothetical protein
MKILLLLLALVLPACIGPAFEAGDTEPVGQALGGLGDACGGTCSATQVCGLACADTPGCYTPGGTEVAPTKNDCPSCFPHPEKDATCAGTSATDGITTHPTPHAYLCQPDAEPLGGCAIVGGVSCC